MPSQSYFVPAPDASRVVEMAAAPALPVVGSAIATSITMRVPVHSGSARRHFDASAPSRYGIEGDGSPVARVYIGSSVWHFLEYEYGNAHNVATRPVSNGVQALGLRWEPTGK